EFKAALGFLFWKAMRCEWVALEVGLGGRLDATNVCDRPLTSIITSISREHWQRLGPTLADIAWEKAGILKPNCPAVVGQVPPEAAAVIHRRLVELNCPVVYPLPTKNLGDGWAEYQASEASDVQSALLPNAKDVLPTPTIKYRSPLLGDVQRQNAALAIATFQLLRQQGWQLTDAAIVNGIAKTKWAGRLQWFHWQGHKILLDGAHNPASAEALRQFVDGSAIGTKRSPSIHWVMGMLSTKDHADVFKALLRKGDHLYLVPVPDHSTAEPETLAAIAHKICPDLATCQIYPDVRPALKAAIDNSLMSQSKAAKVQSQTDALTVLCGSLYLIGHFFQATATAP
ncbi:MAG: bifunctional folylpolyglutamate synthase/dihydrofolate synthase, partial [Leptolyngbya sp.]|nr:bifunctional folylpolyglutamate synthase/dihydrofolate synthase [Candidatus Melainabacteria bacterium]